MLALYSDKQQAMRVAVKRFTDYEYVLSLFSPTICLQSWISIDARSNRQVKRTRKNEYNLLGINYSNKL